MSERTKQLIKQAIDAAKAKGLTQEQVALSVGMSAAGLIRAKKRGNIGSSTLEALGTLVDMELVFVPRKTKEKAKLDIKSGTFLSAAPLVIRTSSNAKSEEK